MLKFLIPLLALIAFPQNNSMLGTEFVFAIPRNVSPNNSETVEIFELLICASEDATVNIYNRNQSNLLRTLEVSANECFSFRSDNFINFEIDETGYGDYNSTKCFYVESSADITLSFISSKNVSSDAFSIYPIKTWGKSYVHNSFPDAFSFSGDNSRDFTGFLILSSEENTNIEVNFEGETSQINLNKFEVYNTKIRSPRRGNTVDLSGTQITSDKPISIISYNELTRIPSNFDDNGADFLVEMMMPKNTWGRSYLTTQLRRDGNNIGDLFRLIGAEDNTQVNIKSYDPVTNEIINDFDISINSETVEEIGNIQGLTHWESDKPFSLMQYSYSSQYHNSDIGDPFMMTVFPVEQFTNQIKFKTPLPEIFERNFVNLIFTTDNPDELLSTQLNGNPLINDYPELVANKVVGQDIYFLTIEIDNSVTNTLISDAKFNASLYGFTQYHSYGYSLAGSFYPADFIAPSSTVTENCFEYTYLVSENEEIIKDNTDPIIRNSGLDDAIIISNTNFEVTEIEVDDYTKSFIFKPNDLGQNALAVVQASDAFGNQKIDSIKYSAGIRELGAIDFSIKSKNDQPGDTLELKLFLNKIQDFDCCLKIKYDSKLLFPIGSESLNIENEAIIISDTDFLDSLYQLNFLGLLSEEKETTIDLVYTSDNCQDILLHQVNVNLEACLHAYRVLNQSEFESSVKINTIQNLINFTSPFEDTVYLSIYNAQGMELDKQIFNVSTGVNDIFYDFSSLGNQIIFVRISSNFEDSTHKIMLIE